jgi:hypothetical protein
MATLLVVLSVALIGLPRGAGKFGKVGSSGWSGIPSAAAADVAKPNACGCYRSLAGSCYCGKKTKCRSPDARRRRRR